MKDGHIVRSGMFDQVADAQFLNDVYETNITNYMTDSLEKWRKIK
jgi:ABC-type enterochelin transport system ATPase subunit